MSRPRKSNKGQIQRAPQEAPRLDRFLMTELAPQIKLALPKHLDADRMARIALTALRTTRDLALCSPASFGACVLSAAQLGLEVSTPLGHAYLIPRRPKGWRGGQPLECTLQIGYRGMLELARRSGQVSSIYAYTVHAGDTFNFRLGLDPTIEHVPDLESEQQPATMTHVYAVAALRGGEQDRQFVVLPRSEVERRRKRGLENSPAWVNDYLAMARKTAVRALFTWLPTSPEMVYAQRVDEAPEIGQSIIDAADPDVIDALDSIGVIEQEAVPRTGTDEGEEADRG